MSHADIEREAGCITAASQALSGGRDDYDHFMHRARSARYVLIGGASSGTHEFFKGRSDITERLIYQMGFAALAVDGDWSDACSVNRYAQGREEYANPALALAGLDRFPSWLWRNAVLRDFVGWLRPYNDGLMPGTPRINLFGLDLYGLHSAAAWLLAYLDEADPAAARQARQHLAQLDHVGTDAHADDLAAALGPAGEGEVVSRLAALRQQNVADLADGGPTLDESFYTERRATLEQHAGHYFRAMLGDGAAFRSERAHHLADSLEALSQHLSSGGRPAKLVVWAHSSQVGDAGHSERGARGEVTLGQLLRRRHGEETLLVGFTTNGGAVTAAPGWGDPPRAEALPAAPPGTYEHLFHHTGQKAFYLDTAGRVAREGLQGHLLERAIGLVYRPDVEGDGGYYAADLTHQFDVVIHIDATTALRPLHPGPYWRPGA